MDYRKVEKEVFRGYAQSILKKPLTHKTKIMQLAKWHVSDIIENAEASLMSGGGTFDTKFNMEMLDVLCNVGFKKDWEKVKAHKGKDSFYKEILGFERRLKIKQERK